MSELRNSTFRSGGFLGVLTILFIALKLCGLISWGWLWVMAPLWIPVALVGCFVMGMLLFVVLLGGAK
jgi:hypothetical protein